MDNAAPSLPALVRAGGRAQLQLPRGHVSATLVPLALHRRRRSATYELRVVNETGQDLSSRAYVVGGRRGRESVSWVELQVPAASAVAMELDIPTPESGRFERALVELDAPGTHLTLFALPPSARYSGTALSAIVALVSVCALIIALGSWWLWERPRMLALAADVDALRVQVQHMAQVPRAPIAAVPRPLAPAQILDFSARRIETPSGQRIVADYRAVGREGVLHVTDRTGRLLDESVFSRSGHTVFQVPQAQERSDLSLSFTVTRGTSRAKTAISLPPPLAAALVDRAGSAVPPGAPFALGSSVVRGGGPLHVSVLRYEPDLHLALVSDDNREIDGEDVDAGVRDVALEVPAVAVPARFTIVATYARGTAQETVVAPLSVLPPQ
ncbi:hypothetical protein EPN44_10590 [bacterium]|nr:MAG: hypothetical protein EPN44_10590 [bacterium]